MLRLHYTGDSVLVADEVGEAVVSYARALAEAGKADVVSVPITDADGRVTIAEFLLGPASQIYVTPAEGVETAGDDPTVVDELQRRIMLLHPSASTTSPRSTPEYDHDAS